MKIQIIPSFELLSLISYDFSVCSYLQGWPHIFRIKLRKALLRITQINAKIFFRKSSLKVKSGTPKLAGATTFLTAKAGLSNSLHPVSGLALCVRSDQVQLHTNKYLWLTERRGLFFSHIRHLEVGTLQQMDSSVVTTDSPLFYLFALPYPMESMLKVISWSKTDHGTSRNHIHVPGRRKKEGTRAPPEASQMTPSLFLKSFPRSPTLRLLFTTAGKCFIVGLNDVSTQQQ